MTALNISAQDSLTNSQKDLLYILQNYRKPNIDLDSIKKKHIEKYGNNFNIDNVPRKYYRNLYAGFTVKDYDNLVIKQELLSVLSFDYTDKELKALQKIYPKEKRYIRTHKDYQYPKINKYDIKLAGYIYLKEAIPILIEGLKRPNQYDREMIYLVLARMQVEPYYSEVANNTIKQIKDSEGEMLVIFFMLAHKR